jgi:hypothetical protein
MVTELSIGITAEVIKMFSLGALAFIISVLLTPALTHFLYKYSLGKQIREIKMLQYLFLYTRRKKALQLWVGY